MNTFNIAFITPLAYGHANVHYAVLRNLLTEARKDLRIHLHVIGDEPQRTRLQSLPASEHATLDFHPMAERDYHHAFASAGGGALVRGPPLSLARKGGLRMLDPMAALMFPQPAEYVERYHKIVTILERVQPDLLVIDVIFSALGADAVQKTEIPFVILAPGFSLDSAGPNQPGGRGFWKYPWMFTNLTYPLPLYLAPVNIFLAIYFIFFIMTVPKRRQVDAARREAGLSGSVLSTPGTGGRGNIHASLAELEYPHVPNPNTLFAGPILSPVSAEWDASSSEMAQFLAVGKTVLINLGSLFSYTEDDVTAIARAIVNVQSRLRDRKGFRVLWKLPQKSRFKAILEDILVVDRANVQITEWIESPVIVVLQHPNVVAVVHHGGANSFIEATYSGVPQVILPAWFDLYTFAVRAEWLGIGIYANKGAEPRIDPGKLMDALLCVLRDEDGAGARLRARADEVSKICKRERGDRKAADAILRAAGGRSVLA